MFQALTEIRDLYTPQECWNYFKADGYVSSQKSGAPGRRGPCRNPPVASPQRRAACHSGRSSRRRPDRADHPGQLLLTDIRPHTQDDAVHHQFDPVRPCFAAASPIGRRRDRFRSPHDQWGNIGSCIASAGTAGSSDLSLLRQSKNCQLVTSCGLAKSATFAPGTRLSAAFRARSAALRMRRPDRPWRTSILPA